jgi:hypothetical protein
MEQQRRHFEEQQGGPLKVYRSVVAYLSNERRLGRIADRCSPEHAARILMGSCFSQAMLEAMVGTEARIGSDEHFAKEVVRTLMEGLDPRKGTAR